MPDNLSHNFCYVCFLFSVDMINSGEEGDVPAVPSVVKAKWKKRKVNQSSPAPGIKISLFMYLLSGQ